jgi:WD40 repeat protein
MNEAFISYSRRDIEFVRRLHDALQRAGRNAWVDWEGIPPSAEWMKEIHAAIEAADTFLVVLSSNSVTSEVCSREILHAAGNNKRLIPIVCDDIHPNQVPAAVAERNWIFFRAGDDFDRAFASLLSAIDTDLDWVKRHTRLLTRAVEWQNHGRDYGYALHGSDLQESERDLSLGQSKEPQLTALQVEYILQSRRDTNRRRNFALTAASIAALVLIAVGLLFWEKRRESILDLAGDFRERALTELANGNPMPAEVFFARSLVINDVLETRQYLLQARAKAARLLWVDAQPPDSTLLAFSPDGAWSILQTKTAVEVWDLRARKPIYALPIAGKKITAVAFSNNGRFLAVGHDNSIEVWRVAASVTAPAATIADVAAMTSLAIAPDGNLVVAGASDGTMYAWDVTAQPAHQIAHVRSHPNRISSLAFTADGQSLVSGSWDNSAKVWAVSAASGQPALQELRTLAAHDDAVLSVALSPNGDVIATGSWDNRIWLWDLRTGQRLRLLVGHSGGIVSLAFSADGQHLASGSEDRTARVWQVETGRPELALPGPESNVTLIAFANGTGAGQLAVADQTGTSRLWDLDAIGQRDELTTLRGHLRPVNGLSFNPAADQLASGGWDKSVRLWDLRAKTQRVLTAANDHADSVTVVRFNADGAKLASASKDGTIREWTMADGSVQVFKPNGDGAPIIMRDVSFSPDGSLIAAACDDGQIRVWNNLDGRLLSSLPMDRDAVIPAKVMSVAFSPDGRLLASANESGLIEIWQAADWSIAETLRGHTDEVWQVAFSLDGKRLISVSDDRSARVWDVATGKQIGDPLKHEGPVWSIAVAPDGKTFATGSSDSTAHIWTLPSAQEPAAKHLFTLQLSDDPIWVVAFSRHPGDTMLAFAGADRVIRVLDINRLNTLFDRPPELEHQANVESGIEIAAGPDIRIVATPPSAR